jgi:prepilin-type N-terminal cleavage/methylation domain-containing protein
MKIKIVGFTLIELLIVVAIIAILAAIAVPNFLEAQTRSKVVRVKADMRSVALAMGAYYVDNNIYIYNAIKGTGPTNNGVSEFLRWTDRQGKGYGLGYMLTTPISYLSTIPIDYFNSKRVSSSIKGYGISNASNCSFFYRNIQGTYYDYTPQSYLDGLGYHCFLVSVGPDILWHTETSRVWDNIGEIYDWYYDPTNGTVSGGDIFYFDSVGFRGGGIGK